MQLRLALERCDGGGDDYVASTGELAVIDPGPVRPDHTGALLAALRGENDLAGWDDRLRDLVRRPAATKSLLLTRALFEAAQATRAVPRPRTWHRSAFPAPGRSGPAPRRCRSSANRIRPIDPAVCVPNHHILRPANGRIHRRADWSISICVGCRSGDGETVKTEPAEGSSSVVGSSVV
jgi:hypothetical protein